jgi:outer membrane protein TolC
MRYFQIVLVSIFTLVLSSGSASENEVLKLTPETLRQSVLESNTSILIKMNQVYQSKLNVNLARANLLPSLNLGVVLNANQGNFIFSAVSILMPFLIPSNWFNYRQNEALFEAEKQSYYLLKLNTYASAYSAYQVILEDLSLREILNTQYQNLIRIRDVIARRVELGLVSRTDLIQAESQVQMAMVDLSQIDGLLHQEHAILRQTLAIPLNQEFGLEPGSVPEAEYETTSPQELVEMTLKISPEYKQINAMIKAADEGKWSKVFAFLSSASLIGSVSTSSASVSFNPVLAGSSFNIGFGLVPAVQLSDAAVEQLKLRKTEIELEQAKVVETVLSGLVQAKIQFENAEKAEAGLQQVLEMQIKRYYFGLTDVLHVLDSQNSVTKASVSRVRSQMDLDSLRITMHRILQSDQFAKIEGCHLLPEKSQNFWGKIKDFFSSSSSQKSLDELCQQQTK